ncbi:MAG: hypothetical protein IKD58_06200 [Loktanella sp.]|nr:hypothetical protein [Loktanella sp.]
MSKYVAVQVNPKRDLLEAQASVFNYKYRPLGDEQRLMGRVAEKECAWDRDEEQLRRVEITLQELQREYFFFRSFRKDVIGLKPKYKPVGIDFVFVDSET